MNAHANAAAKNGNLPSPVRKFVAPPIGTVVFVPRIKLPFQKTLPVVDISQGKVKGPMIRDAVPIQFRAIGKSIPVENVFRNRADAVARAAELAEAYIAERQAEIESVKSSVAGLVGKKTR